MDGSRKTRAKSSGRQIENPWPRPSQHVELDVDFVSELSPPRTMGRVSNSCKKDYGGLYGLTRKGASGHNTLEGKFSFLIRLARAACTASGTRKQSFGGPYKI